jgi:hypothetical protein
MIFQSLSKNLQKALIFGGYIRQHLTDYPYNEGAQAHSYAYS